MLTHLERILGWYAQRPVEVREKRTSRMKEHLREQESRQRVEVAVNRYLYESER